MQANILIATPTYGGRVTTEYMMSIIRLRDHFASVGIKSAIYMNDSTVIHVSRNLALSKFHAYNVFSHLLFVDSDMDFQPEAVMKLLKSGKDLCGCICPARTVDFRAFFDAALRYQDFDVAKAVSQKFISTDKLAMRPSEGGYEYAIDDGFLRTLHIGCGLTLISRFVADEMYRKCTDLIISANMSAAYRGFLQGEKINVLQAFDPIRMEDNSTLSEDTAFCYRWRADCGGEVWACVDQKIGHVGSYKAEGTAIDHLMQHKPTRQRS